MSSEDKTYNGWTNHGTWCVNLWLTNDEGTYRHCRSLADDAKDAADDAPQVLEEIWTIEEATRFLLADALPEFAEEINPLADQASVFTDLITSALAEVNWHEIADAFLEE